MFVSSFSTYVTNNTSDKSTKVITVNREEKNSSFSNKLSKNMDSSSLKLNTSVNYVSEGQSQHNKQMIELSRQSIQSEKKDGFKSANAATKLFSSNATLQSAKVAYSSNSSMFSLLKKPSATINQTPRVDKSLPVDIQEIKEKNMRNIMVNTYLENDNYYQITA